MLARLDDLPCWQAYADELLATAEIVEARNAAAGPGMQDPAMEDVAARLRATAQAILSDGARCSRMEMCALPCFLKSRPARR